MIAKLEEIETLTSDHAEKLGASGITNAAQLLEQGASRAGRAQLATACGVDEKLILTWVNHIDLSRIKGVREQFGEMLEVAGVDTVVELATRVPANLAAKLAEVNEGNKIAGRTPTLADVEDWVAQAKELPRVITH
jgi:predicted flap endonuclease-1-like 5' DNA nuclease